MGRDADRHLRELLGADAEAKIPPNHRKTLTENGINREGKIGGKDASLIAPVYPYQGVQRGNRGQQTLV